MQQSKQYGLFRKKKRQKTQIKTYHTPEKKNTKKPTNHKNAQACLRQTMSVLLQQMHTQLRV